MGVNVRIDCVIIFTFSNIYKESSEYAHAVQKITFIVCKHIKI